MDHSLAVRTKLMKQLPLLRLLTTIAAAGVLFLASVAFLAARPLAATDSTGSPLPSSALSHGDLVRSRVASEPAGGTSALDHRRVSLPALNASGECSAEIVVQNVGAVFSKFVLLLWGEPGGCGSECAGPFAVLDSQTVEPGYSFEFRPPPAARTGVVYSFSMEDTDGDGVPDADEAIAYFRDTVRGNCEEWRGVDQQLRATGTGLAGESLGAPITAVVRRECASPEFPNAVVGAYRGLAEGEAGQVFGTDAYTYTVPLTGMPAGRVVLHLANLSLDCTAVELAFVPRSTGEDCAAPITDTVPALAPGESLPYDVGDRLGLDFQGAAWVKTTLPVAVLVEHTDRDVQFTTTAQAVSKAWTESAAAPMYAGYRGWTSELWVVNTDVDATAAVSTTLTETGSTDVMTGTVEICPQSVGVLSYSADPLQGLQGRVDIGSTASVLATVHQVRYEGPAKANMLEAMSFDVPSGVADDGGSAGQVGDVTSVQALPLVSLGTPGALSELDQDLIVYGHGTPSLPGLAVDLFPTRGRPTTCHFDAGSAEPLALNLSEMLRWDTTVAAVVRRSDGEGLPALDIASVAEWRVVFPEQPGDDPVDDYPGDTAMAYSGARLMTDYTPPDNAFDCLAGHLLVAPTELAVETDLGGADAVSRTLTMVNVNDFGPEFEWRLDADAPWITFPAASGMTPDAAVVALHVGELPVGRHTATITVSATDDEVRDAPQDVAVEVLVHGQSPVYLPVVRRSD